MSGVSEVTVGVDVGGTKIAAGAVTGDGRILQKLRRDSPAGSEQEIGRTIQELVTELAGNHAVAAVGVAAAGFVDAARSSVRYAPNLAWTDVPLRDQLESSTGLPVVVENDANAAAWGEARFGAGEGIDNLLMVTVGTGVGGGIVIDGELLRGAYGVAAEVGHIRMVRDGLLCGCGNRGCWEQYASGSALVRDARVLAATDPSAAKLIELAGGSAEHITGPQLTEAAVSGDAFSITRLADLGHWLGEGLATLVAVLDPELIVIGGGVAEAGDLLLGPARVSFRAALTGQGHRPEAEIRLAALGNQAGLVGVADLARRL